MHQCIFCENSKVVTLIPADAIPCNVNVLKCASCGLVFLEARVTEEEFDPEEKVYWDSDEQKQIYLGEKIQHTFLKEFDRRLFRIESFLKKPGRVLDVGCGVGHFLVAARTHGWRPQGLDISKAASEAAHEAYGLEVSIGTLDQAAFPERTFDVITLWDVIEHVRKPIESLKAANRFLRPGGILAMKTPNEDSFFKWVARTCFRLFGKKGSFLLKYVYYVPHYFSYSKKTMTKLLEKTGFEVIRYEMDETPAEFATEKINVHYKRDPKRKLVIALLPLAQLIARTFGMSNKMVVYARKVKDVVSDTKGVS